MDYIETPIIFQEENDFVGSLFEKTSEFSAYAGVGVVHTESNWTITKVSDGSIAESGVVSSGDLTRYTRQNNLESNETYRVTVEYVSDRFGGQMSDGYEFTFIQTIDKPTISTTEDINSFPDGGVFTTSLFSGLNDIHVSTDWEIRDFNTDELLWSSYADTVNLESVTFSLSADTASKDLKVRARHNGEFVDSGWSDFLSFYTEELPPGVGPATLLAGDMTDGFFGETTSTELITGDALASAIGLTAGVSQNSNVPWWKFAIDGEIIYVPTMSLRNDVSWDDINAVNAVYNDANSPIINIDGFQFRVTLMTGAEADPTVNENGEGSEWNRLIYRVHSDVPTDQVGDNWAEYNTDDTNITSGDGRYIWFQ